MRLLRRAFAALTFTPLVAVLAQTPAVPDSADARLIALVRDSVPKLMERMAIPGAVVTVVRGDRVVLTEAFGLSNVAGQVPVTDRTVFRTASVTKVFTAMAALRLAAEGRLDLNADIAQWVPDVDVGATPEQPVTVAQLLMHTSGVDDLLLGYVNSPGEAPPPLAEFLPSAMPPRTRAPVNAPSYSNYGYALIGLIVERIAKVPFERFVEDSLLGGLGLRDTRFLMRPSLDTAHALEYTSEGDLRTQRSSKPYPAGNLATSATDMSVFLRALLTTPESDPARRLLFTPALTYHDEMPPTGYGFAVSRIAGRDVWMKGGAGPSHSAVIAVLPEANVAIFIAVNRQEPTLWTRLLRLMVAAISPPAPPVVPVAAADAALEGDYLWTRVPLSTFERVLGLGAQVRVQRLGPDTLQVVGPFAAGTYLRDGALRYRTRNGTPLAFRVGEDGRAAALFTIDAGQPITFDRIPLHQTTRFQMAVLGGGTALALVAAVMTARRRPSDELQPAWARTSVMALPVIQLAMVGSAFVLAKQGDRLLEGPTSGLYSTLALTTVTAAVAIAQSAGSATLSTNARSHLVRATYGASAVAGIGIVWFLGANNLIGLRF